MNEESKSIPELVEFLLEKGREEWEKGPETRALAEIDAIRSKVREIDERFLVSTHSLRTDGSHLFADTNRTDDNKPIFNYTAEVRITLKTASQVARIASFNIFKSSVISKESINGDEYQSSYTAEEISKRIKKGLLHYVQHP